MRHTHQLITLRSEVVPDIAETLTAWVVPAVRDRQSLTTHGTDCRCEAVHGTKAGYAPVPRNGSYESWGCCGCAAVTAHDHMVATQTTQPSLRRNVLSSLHPIGKYS